MTEKRRPGRPATGETPTRSLRVPAVYDLAKTLAEQTGTTITAVVTRALEEYVMEQQTITLPELSEGTRAGIANLVDYKIEREYGYDVDAMITGATSIAVGGLMLDLRDQYVSANGGDQGLRGYADTVLRILVREGLAARVCQCRQLHPHGCKHGSAVGQLWCGGHYEADVPPIDGALLCGTCHVTEHQARQGAGALQIVTDVESDTDGLTRGWIVPAGTTYDPDVDLEAVDHIDIPTTEDPAQWEQGLRDELAAAGYALTGEITRDGSVITATVSRA